MGELLLPILLVLFVWWFSTGAILYLGGLPRWTFKWTVLGASVLALAALAGLRVSSAGTGVASACCAFVCAIVVWGWVEVGFLMGGVTGPRTVPCPPGIRGSARFSAALGALLYHELVLIIVGGFVVLITVGQPNTLGMSTFLLLWAMRQSAKINLFLGVPNLFAHLLPPHLAYLASYQRSDRISLFFPISVGVATVVTVWIARGIGGDASPFEATGAVLLATLAALAVLEHAFMVLPLPTDALWSWGLSSRAAVAAPSAAERSPPVARAVSIIHGPAKPEARPSPLD